MKKICILAIMLITNLCANYFTGENKLNVEEVVQEQTAEIVIENLTNTEIDENEVVDEVLENEPIIEDVKIEIVEKKQENVNQERSKSEINKSAETATIIPPQNVQNIDNSQINVSEINVEEKPNTNSNTSESKNVPIETTKPTQEPTEPTQSDLSYWCMEGGSHHVLGDGANEHGYYSSWDEANNACMSYTKGWTSMQYKINECACGLYYFWAIQ